MERAEAKDSKVVPGGTENNPDAALAAPRATDWDDLRIFVIVAREGSLGRAAKALNVAKPTIRRRIENLEAAIGAPLFDRRRTGVALTARGHQTAAMAEEMAMMMGKIFSNPGLPGDAVEGECKLVMSDGLATNWFVPNFLRAFSERHPRVVLRLAAAPDTDKIAVPPFDIQVRYAPVHDEDIFTVRVGTFHFTYFASQRYIDRFGMPRTQEELSHHRLADIAANTTGNTGLMSQYSNASTLGRPTFLTNSGNIVCRAVAAGEMIGLLPTYTYLCESDLVPVLPDYHFKTGLFLYFSEAAAKRASSRAMIDFLRDVVFDKRAMPWFGDVYISPQKAWRRIFADLCEGARGASAASAVSTSKQMKSRR